MMKKFLLLAISIAVMTPEIFATEPSISWTVLNSFRKQFGDVESVSWRIVPNENIYIGQYLKDGIRKEAFFKEDGKLIGEGQYISVESLPVTIQKIVGKSFSNYELAEAYEFYPVNAVYPVYALLVENQKEKLQLKMDQQGEISVVNKKRQTHFPVPVNQSARKFFTGFDEAAFRD